MRKVFKAVVAVVSLSAMAALVTPSVAEASHRDIDIQPLREIVGFRTGDIVIPSASVFERTDDGVKTEVFTRATPGNAYTLWYLVFNAPENCIDGCGRHNIFTPEGAFNEAQIEAARISVVWAGAGDVADRAGFLRLSGSLAEGDFPDGPQQVVVGRAEDNAFAPVDAPVTGIEDVSTAEIHIVARAHGPASEDADELERQLSQFAACNPSGLPLTCVDAQTAGHRP